MTCVRLSGTPDEMALLRLRLLLKKAWIFAGKAHSFGIRPLENRLTSQLNACFAQRKKPEFCGNSA
jgi:hypothetical protein